MMQGDVTGEYDAIDKETAIAADRQVSGPCMCVSVLLQT